MKFRAVSLDQQHWYASVGDTVNTPDGKGKIMGKDLGDCDCWRYIVNLDKNPYSYENVCYFPNEVKKYQSDN